MLDGHVVQRNKPEEDRKLHHHKIKGNIQESCNFPSFMVRITTFVYPKDAFLCNFGKRFSAYSKGSVPLLKKINGRSSLETALKLF